MSKRSDVNRTKVLTLILAAILLLAIAGTILIVLFPQPSEPFTEVYLLGPGGKASGYPTKLTGGQTGNVTVGVVNHENANVDYRLVATLENKTVTTKTFSLANGQPREDSISFTPTTRGVGQKMQVDLYKGSDTNVYRSVYLVLTVN